MLKGSRNVPVKGRTTGVTGTRMPLASAISVIVKLPVIDPSGTWDRTAGERSMVPSNVPAIAGILGTWTLLLPGALTTTSNVP